MFWQVFALSQHHSQSQSPNETLYSALTVCFNSVSLKFMSALLRIHVVVCCCGWEGFERVRKVLGLNKVSFQKSLSSA